MNDKDNSNESRQAQNDWENGPLADHHKAFPERRPVFSTSGGVPVAKLYTPLDIEERGIDYLKDIGFPGQPPFTRGISPGMYRTQPWMMFQYSGFGDAEQTNKLWKYLIANGVRGLALAVDLPGQIGYDADNPVVKGEVGKAGLSVCSLRDMELLFDGIPAEQMSHATVANAVGPIFLALYLALFEKQGSGLDNFTVWLQNDPLKEFVTRGAYNFPPDKARKFACDVVEYVVQKKLMKVSPIWYCGYHFGEGGSTAAQEIAFAIGDGISYTEELIGRGIKLDDFGSRVLWNMTAGVDFFEEICKYRALRRLWYRVATEQFGVQNPISAAVRIASYTQGSGFTAQQPIINIVRGTIGGMAAVLGGCQSLVISAYDEALALPSDEAIRVALRTQQIIEEESRVTLTPDPLAGSYFVESLTKELEEAAKTSLERIKAQGGAVKAIESGWTSSELTRSAYDKQRQIERGERTVVGVNKYQMDEKLKVDIKKVDPCIEEEQIKRLQELRRTRDNREVTRTLKDLEQAAKRGENTVEPILAAIRAYATVGEVCGVLRGIWGEYVPVRGGI